MRWGLQGRIIAPVMLVSGLAVVLSAFLNYGKFVRTFTELEGSRFTFIADDIKGTIEGGLDLGVALRGMVTAQSVIQDEAERDPQIYGILLFNGDGTILFRTGKASYGETVPAAWVTAANGRETNWSAVDGEIAIAGTRLTNDIRQTVGGIAVLYSRETRAHLLREMAEKLTLGAIVGGIVVAALALPGVTLLLRRIRRDLKRAEAALESASADDTSLTAEARRKADAALREIAAATQDVERVEGGVAR